MANYAKLLKGAQSKLMQMQKELAEQARLLFPDAPPEVPVYHGSPFVFDKFDWESNLRKGEGAMAFGPGGYMTGSRQLAEHYADALTKRHSGATPSRRTLNLYPLDSYDYAPNLMVKKDPIGALEYFRAAELRAALEQKLGDNTLRKAGMKTVKSKDPNSADKWENAIPLWQRVGVNDDYKRYLDAIEGTIGLDKFPVSRRNSHWGTPSANRAVINEKNAGELLDLGKLLHSKTAGLRPEVELSAKWAAPWDQVPVSPERRAQIEGYDWYKNSDPERQKALLLQAIPPEGGRIVEPMNIRNNLEVLNRVFAGENSGLNKFRPMPDGGMRRGMDLNDYYNKVLNWNGQRVDNKVPGKKGDPSIQRSVYEAILRNSPNELLMYDWPLKDHPDTVRGALSQLADELGFSWFHNPEAAGMKDPTGRDFIREVPNNLKGMQMLREAGIPATAFLRAGRRGELPKTFDPNDFNFVIHDQGRVDLKARKDKATGGVVA